jgi:hypothetical protein
MASPSLDQLEKSLISWVINITFMFSNSRNIVANPSTKREIQNSCRIKKWNNSNEDVK